jgi:RNA polymerase sigma-70 factor, ECF subfamily
LRAEARTPTPLAVRSRDSELVARVRAGDEAACEALYLAHHDALWRFAYAQVRCAEVAEELVQEVFLALWRDRAAWEVTTSVRAWLYGAVRNQALNHLRHERVVTRLADRAVVGAGGGAGHAGVPAAMALAARDALAELEARELDDAVTEALAALPERRRLAMTLRWTHDLPAPEIARVLGTTPEAVRVLLARARQELGALLRRVRG